MLGTQACLTASCSSDSLSSSSIRQAAAPTDMGEELGGLQAQSPAHGRHSPGVYMAGCNLSPSDTAETQVTVQECNPCSYHAEEV